MSRMIGRQAVTRTGAIHRRLATRFFFHVGKADPDLVFVAGVGRSGTTWLAEMLGRPSRRRLLFEPFHPERVPLWSGARPHQYIRPADERHPLLEPARKILAGSVRNHWVDQLSSHIVTRGRLIKDIRANLALRWLYEQLGPFPVILLIRHPAAVAASWMKLGWSRPPAEIFLTQPELVEDFLHPVRDEIASASAGFDSALFTWAIGTAVPLSQFPPEELLVVFYEHLVADPSRELKRIASHIGGDFAELRITATDDPSPTSTRGTAYASQDDRLRAWQTSLTKQQLRRLRDVTSLFGLEDLYGEDGLPAEHGLAGLGIHSCAAGHDAEGERA